MVNPTSIPRYLQVPPRHSFFLFGPRQCGKSTLVSSLFSKNVWNVDLLNSHLFLRYSENPSLFRQDALYQIRKGIKTIVVDEVQKIPILLNEVHALIEKTRTQFVLTGSSPRKLKRGGANLLAGRAFERFLFPFIYREIKNNFVLEKALRFGTMPGTLYFEEDGDKIDFLTTYTHTYLREEIQAEGFVRDLGGFVRFLDMACAQFTEITSFSGIANEVLKSPKLVREYYQILEDTLIGYTLPAWKKSVRKQLTSHPKFYFFDNGVTNAVNHLLKDEPGTMVTGKLFEQWLINEIRALVHYEKSDVELFYWRTNNGAEVDLIIAKHHTPVVALEFKYSSNITSKHLTGLKSFHSEYPDVPVYVVGNVPHPYELGKVTILPWALFLEEELPKMIS